MKSFIFPLLIFVCVILNQACSKVPSLPSTVYNLSSTVTKDAKPYLTLAEGMESQENHTSIDAQGEHFEAYKTTLEREL